MATRLTLISHVATQAQYRAAFPLDEPLEEREIAKATALGWNALRAQRVLAAPELRAQQTARALGLSAENSMELRDCEYGIWRGREMADVQSVDPEGILAWLTDSASAPHGGESIESLTARTGAWMEKQRDVNHTIAVTHPAVIRAAIVYALKISPQTFWRFDVAPLSLTDLRLNNGVWTVRCTACHLEKSPCGGSSSS